MKRNLIILLVCIAAVFAGCDTGNDPIDDIKIADVADGTYSGAHHWFPVTVRVKVTVENGVLTDIKLIEHFNGQGQAAEQLLDDVIEAQSLKVDAITGATYSSVTMLNAIEDALKKGLPDDCAQ